MKFLLFGFGKLGERKRKCVCVHVRVCLCIHLLLMGECKYINKQGKYNKRNACVSATSLMN